ncbi:MAG: ammonia-forming cytochrome c nitrite reductase subunit c552, partial [Ignavibacteriales bacterium]|nr:ammonia-forming cytochrome c nitrite reductase subunit c552 [Ignavibacteriales bacterium]
KDVYERQEKVEQLRRLCEKTIAIAHIEAKVAWNNGATEQQMKPILTLIRHAQFRWDYVAAANGMGFHSPAEALRILGMSIRKGEEARRLLAVLLVKLGLNYPINLPDFSTKKKAQKFIGLDMGLFIKDKIEFLKTTVVEWDKKAKERQGTLIEY